MLIKCGTNSVSYDEIISTSCAELLFEETDGWVLTYELLQLDYMMEYSQSTGRGEICGVCDKTVGRGEIEMHFTSDGKKNKETVAAYKNETPHFYGQAKRYLSLIKK